MTLHGRSSQKMARVLSELNKMGLVRKAQSRSRKKMIYMAVSQLEEQGITLSAE
jgi:DNA-binding transcriptional regulator GbsR (MarR family)